MSVRLVPWAALLALALAARPAAAQSTTRRVQQLVDQAQQAYVRGDAEGAIRALERAYRLRRVPLLLFNIGRAHELAGRLDVAIEYYDRFLATAPPPEQADAAREARRAAQQTLDDRARPRPPASASAPPPAARLTVAPAARAVPPPPPGRRFTALHGTLVAGGGALAVAGGVLGVLALGAAERFGASSDPGTRAGLQDQGTAFAWGANVGLGLGLVAAAAGLILYLAQQPERPTPATEGP